MILSRAMLFLGFGRRRHTHPIVPEKYQRGGLAGLHDLRSNCSGTPVSSCRGTARASRAPTPHPPSIARVGAFYCPHARVSVRQSGELALDFGQRCYRAPDLTNMTSVTASAITAGNPTMSHELLEFFGDDEIGRLNPWPAARAGT